MRFQNTVTAARNDALPLNELNPAGVPEPETDARAWFSADCSFLRIKLAITPESESNSLPRAWIWTAVRSGAESEERVGNALGAALDVLARVDRSGCTGACKRHADAHRAHARRPGGAGRRCRAATDEHRSRWASSAGGAGAGAAAGGRAGGRARGGLGEPSLAVPRAVGGRNQGRGLLGHAIAHQEAPGSEAAHPAWRASALHSGRNAATLPHSAE